MTEHSCTSPINELKSPRSAQLSHLQLSGGEGNVVCSVLSFPLREGSQLLLLWTDGASGTAAVSGTGAATCEGPGRGFQSPTATTSTCPCHQMTPGFTRG